MKPLYRFPIMLLMASSPLMASAVTYESSMADRQGLSLTVYEQSQTLVRDTRSVQTGQGRFDLVVQDVSERIQPETLMLESNGRLRLSGATFNTALLTPENLMKAYIGTITGGVITSAFSDAIVFAILIIVLLVRPSGLMGEPETEKV